ncbi:MAG: conjugal transfer protein TraN [Sphingomonadaceae bacterium]|nr:conjugal transfer protein TraN [Sphingomonadaceae bacterium]
MAVAACPVAASAQVYIPPPDDLIEPVPPLPPDSDPGNGSPLAPPPALPLPPMDTEQAKAEARAIGSASRDANKDITQDPNALGQVPVYTPGMPAEASFYGNDTALPGAGASAADTSEGFRTVHDPSRPVVPVQRSDIQRAVDVEADPQTYLEGENYNGTEGECVPLPPGNGAGLTAEWTCNVGTGVIDQEDRCYSNLTVDEWNENLYKYLCVVAPGFDGCVGLRGNGQCRYTSSYPVPDYNLTVDYYDCDVPVSDPNAYLYETVAQPPPPGAFQVVSNIYRCNNDGLSEALTVDPLTFYWNGYVTGLQQCAPIAADPGCTETTAAASGLVEQTLCKTWEFVGDPFSTWTLICTELAQPEKFYSCSSYVAGAVAERSVSKWFTETWVDAACSVDLGSCSYAREECTAGPETRVVDGVAVTRACWQKSKVYMCQNTVGGLNDCGALEANSQCRMDREICLDDPPTGGGCVVSERVYVCPIAGTTPEPTQYICGDDVYCVNGECEAVQREASTEFKDAVVALNALGQANAEFDETTLMLFSGTRETCSKKVFGLSNCCSGSGVPLLTPWICNAAERLLDQKDDAGLCHKLGTYCSSSILGICVTRKDAYCCFESKISRILQEQGRPQIGKPWGTPKNGTCEGFTIFEFQQLDLSIMDFSEVYAEFQDAARLPDEAAALAEIQAKIEAYYARGTPAPPENP